MRHHPIQVHVHSSQAGPGSIRARKQADDPWRLAPIWGHRDRPKRSPPARRCLSSRAGAAGELIFLCLLLPSPLLLLLILAIVLKRPCSLHCVRPTAPSPYSAPAWPPTRGAFALLLKTIGRPPVLCAVQHQSPDDLVACPALLWAQNATMYHGSKSKSHQWGSWSDWVLDEQHRRYYRFRQDSEGVKIPPPRLTISHHRQHLSVPLARELRL